MAELLFIATTVFVAYVLFTTVGKKDNPEASQPDTQPINNTEPANPPEDTPPPPVAAAAPAKPVSKTSKTKTKAAPAPKTKPAATSTTGDSLKNPKTGEVAKLPGNYAFAKRWIKEALVEEGLLDKIYKNNELDDAATAKIQDALQQLKALEKYQ